jgi:hypothetical protein
MNMADKATPADPPMRAVVVDTPEAAPSLSLDTEPKIAL